jgi:hypothetical protein
MTQAVADIFIITYLRFLTLYYCSKLNGHLRVKNGSKIARMQERYLRPHGLLDVTSAVR